MNKETREELIRAIDGTLSNVKIKSKTIIMLDQQEKFIGVYNITEAGWESIQRIILSDPKNNTFRPYVLIGDSIETNI